MKNSFNQLVNLVTSTNDLSKNLFRIHELAVHQLNLDEMPTEYQTACYFLFHTAKAIKKIEKKAIKQKVNVSEIDSTKLIELIKSDENELSESLICVHNMVCHNIDLMHFTPKVQSSLYFVFEAAKIIRTIEDELKTDFDTSN